MKERALRISLMVPHCIGCFNGQSNAEDKASDVGDKSTSKKEEARDRELSHLVEHLEVVNKLERQPPHLMSKQNGENVTYEKWFDPKSRKLSALLRLSKYVTVFLVRFACFFFTILLSLM